MVSAAGSWREQALRDSVEQTWSRVARIPGFRKQLSAVGSGSWLVGSGWQVLRDARHAVKGA